MDEIERFPAKLDDRIVNKDYLHKDCIVFWNGNRIICKEHNIIFSNCKICSVVYCNNIKKIIKKKVNIDELPILPKYNKDRINYGIYKHPEKEIIVIFNKGRLYCKNHFKIYTDCKDCHSDISNKTKITLENKNKEIIQDEVIIKLHQKKERILFYVYKYYDFLVYYDGKEIKCKDHKIRYDKCKECNKSKLCIHKEFLNKCKKCKENKQKIIILNIEELPNIDDRVHNKEYIYKNVHIIWNDKKQEMKCKDHNKRPGLCTKCQYGGYNLCEHKKERRICKICGNGTGLCEHNKDKYSCTICRSGSSYCEHDRIKSVCKICIGGSICKHSKVKSKCKLCCNGLGSFCIHGKIKCLCNICGIDGPSYCEHGNLKANCIDCQGNNICPHLKQKHHCYDCQGSQICEHNHIRSTCKRCLGGSICDHLIQRSHCKICNPNSYLANTYRSQIKNSIKNYSKQHHSIDYLGCTIYEFKIHLQNQFKDGMTLNNHGEWHIDHIRPCASFDLTNEEELFMCFHYTNLQPLWAKENQQKSSKYDTITFNRVWTGTEWINKN